MPVPELQPRRSPELWQRYLIDFVSQLSVLESVGLSALGIVLATVFDRWVDSLVNFDLIQTALYMVPVGFSAWTCGYRVGFWVACLATISEVLVGHSAMDSYKEPHTNMALAALFTIEFVTMVTGSTIMAKLRYLLEESRLLSRTDHLTGLSNSRHFWDRMELELARMRRDLKPITMVFIDVDDFKKVNDILGHRAGDALLKTIGKTLQGSVRAIDVAARIGGDEFVILLPGEEESAGKLVVERLRSQLNAVQDGAAAKATLSAGVATFRTPPADTEAVIHAADYLMYESKNGGKNLTTCRAY